jgi:integrating conjugative element protein (TIGR03758 family)
MTMTSDMSSAFQSGSGVTATGVGTLIVLIVGAIAVLWLAAVVLSVGSHTLNNSIRRGDAFSHTVRAAIVAMLLIYMLT